MYEVLGQGKHSETEEDLVIYKPLYDSEIKFWARPIEMFFDTKEINGKSVPRFELIEEKQESE